MATRNSVLGPIVNVQLRNSKIVQVHKNVLERSPFFKNALKPEWAEARNGKPIDLTDEDSEIFAGYVSWLYSHNVERETRPLTWAKMYVLGEKLMDPEFQDTLLTEFIQQCLSTKEIYIGIYVKVIYNGTTEGSPARRLLVDLFCYGGEGDWVDILEDLPTQFLKDLFKTSVGLQKPISWGDCPWVKSPESYLLQKKEGNMKVGAQKNFGN